MSIEYIDVPITEYDLESFKSIVYGNDSAEWTLETDKGQYITLRFMSENSEVYTIEKEEV